MQSGLSDRAEQLFLQAVDLPPAVQQSLLNSACGSAEPELRAQVEALLASDHNSAEAIDSAVRSAAALLLEPGVLDESGFPNEPSLLNERLGAYRVLRELGHGGMGTVYLATRDDDLYQKQVAIKVVKRGMDTSEVLARFRRERQILANLDHPYIARLLDAGSAADGRPFFVMEYVEGRSVGDFCRDQALGTGAVCRLFLRVCQAVAHAHRNLVVHRDLKPGNILVTAEGTPKLLDFGVAKLLSPEEPTEFTATMHARPLTPEYASPEQVLGAPVTTATDVYALGAVLFELLTGRRAQWIPAQSPDEMRRAVCETEVPRPSDIVPGLDSDLDNIVLMAMRKDPARRYAGVDQLAADIERYLEGRPISARQDSVVYRTRKFLRRYALQLTALGLVFASLVGATAISVSQSRRAGAALRVEQEQRAVAVRESQEATAARQAEARQHALAEQERDQARQERVRAEERAGDLIDLANRSLFDVHDAIQYLPGAIPARQQIVKTTLKYLERLQKEGPTDDRMRLVLSNGYYRVGMIQGDPGTPSLQQYGPAEVSFHKAQEILAPLYRRNRFDPDLMERWIEIEGSVAETDFRLGRRDAAIEEYARLVPVAHKLGALRADDIVAATQESAMESRLAGIYGSQDTTHALQHARREVALTRNLASHFPQNARAQQELGSSLGTLAGRLQDTGDLEGAAEAFRQSIEIREALVVAEPRNPVYKRGLLIMYGNYAALLGIPWAANLNRTGEARSYSAKAVATARELADADPQNATARYDLAVALSRQGEVDPEPTGIETSLSILEEAAGMLDAFLKENPKSEPVARQLGLAREYVGHRLEAMGRVSEAAAAWREDLKEEEPFEHMANTTLIPNLIANEEALARLYAASGDKASALDFAHRASAHAESLPAGNQPEFRAAHVANSYFVLAAVERDLADWDRARDAAENGLEVWGRVQNAGIRSIFRVAAAQTESLLKDAAGRVTR